MTFIDTQAKRQLGSLKEASPKGTNLLALLKKKKDYHTIWAAIVAALGPLVITILSIVWPVSTTVRWKEPQVYVIFGAFAWTLLHELYFIYKQYLFGLNIIEIESVENQTSERINELTNENGFLRDDQFLLLSVMGKIGKAAKMNECTLDQLATLVAEEIYSDIHKRYDTGTGLTVNIYEYKDHNVNMRGHFQKLILDTNPLLFDENGLPDTDERIKDFCCVKLLQSELSKKTVSDWLQMIDEFSWSHWSDKEKRKIKRKRDREQCLNIGFTYNQYIGLTHKREDGVKFLVEIILHNNEDITRNTGKNIDSVATDLKNVYIQLLDQIWNIGTLKEG